MSLPAGIMGELELWLLAIKQPQNLYGMLLYVQSSTPDDGRKARPKHVECCSKIKYISDIVHLVGFTIGIYYDTRSYKRQICRINYMQDTENNIPQFRLRMA